MPFIELRLEHGSFYFSHQCHAAGYIIVSISNLRKLKFNEENTLVRGHPSGKGWSWDLDQACQTKR